MSREIAEEILKIIRENHILGSDNADTLTQFDPPQDDRIFTIPSLFFRKERQRLLEGLLLEPLKDIAHKSIVETRQINLLEMLNDKNPDYNEKKRQFSKRQAEYSEEDMAGNCGALANYGLWYVKEHKEIADKITGKQLETMNFSKPLDHCLLVLGKDPNIKDGDYRKWNKDVLFIDPWLNKVMNLQEFTQFWKKNFPIINTYSTSDNRYRMFNKMPRELTLKLEKNLDLDALTPSPHLKT